MSHFKSKNLREILGVLVTGETKMPKGVIVVERKGVKLSQMSIVLLTMH